jgi:hypothetical protein
MKVGRTAFVWEPPENNCCPVLDDEDAVLSLANAGLSPLPGKEGYLLAGASKGPLCATGGNSCLTLVWKALMSGTEQSDETVWFD